MVFSTWHYCSLHSFQLLFTVCYNFAYLVSCLWVCNQVARSQPDRTPRSRNKKRWASRVRRAVLPSVCVLALTPFAGLYFYMHNGRCFTKDGTEAIRAWLLGLRSYDLVLNLYLLSSDVWWVWLSWKGASALEPGTKCSSFVAQPAFDLQPAAERVKIK